MEPHQLVKVQLPAELLTNLILLTLIQDPCTELLPIFVAIIPEKKFGIALKIIDGASRASACVLATLLVELGVLNRNHPIAQKYLRLPILNRRGIQTGCIRASEDLHL